MNEQTDTDTRGSAAGQGEPDGTPAAPTVNWDDSEMRSTYANVVNAASTREEVTVFFGSNLTWNPTETSNLHVKLTDRMILNPHAAKRLWILLGVVLNQYEKRHGTLKVETRPQSGDPGKEGGGAGD